jgi:phosphonoacetaldehyde hydrolase
MKKIECIIMDWAGTAVDYGCFAPVAAFIESFNAIGTPVTAAETRAHMGLTKVEEIRALFNIDRVRNEFQEKYGRPYAEEDILARYADFQRVLFASLEDWTVEAAIGTLTVSSLALNLKSLSHHP